ncbi:MAG: glycerol-3-phosphate dehydrogenase/oxidase [Chitinophagaceae bacterium]
MNETKQNGTSADLPGMEGFLNRNDSLEKLQSQTVWDLIIIGGGATGLGVAVDAANRGYATLLLEQCDFAKGTSSRSTKLVHGGVRYLAQGNIGLVYDALHERGLLLKNASHIVKRQAFIIPCYGVLSKFKYLIGLKIYDWLSGTFSFGRSSFINRKNMIKALPEINTKGLVGGIKYFDGQFDDARLAINLAQTSVAQGAVVLNYCKVSKLAKKGGKIQAVTAYDMEKSREYQLRAKTVINATGVFVDDILQMDKPETKPLVRPSQGIHLVFDKSFFTSSNALMIPKTADGRVLFAVPWHDHVLVGTTDTPLNKPTIEPKALDEEVNFILKTMQQYLSKLPTKKDVLSVFAGLRPLAAPQKETGNTKEISRDHKLIVSESGLITITGGKWTTYRKMAEETVNAAIKVGNLEPVPCGTKQLAIHGSITTPSSDDALSIYGTDQEGIKNLVLENPSLLKKLIEELPYTQAEVVWSVRHEMARTVEDVLARRLRILFLDAKAAMNAAPKVAELIAKELNRDEHWIADQLESFYSLANNYLLEPYHQIVAVSH